MAMLRPDAVVFTVLLAAATPSWSQTLANNFLDDSKVQVIQLTMDPVDWATLQQHYLENTYYPAVFTWNGLTVDNIGIRSHGSGSRSPLKPNLDLDFGRYNRSQTFLGLPWVLIKANNEDASNLREWMAMKLFRRMGLPAPREAPAQIYLNSELLGYYTIVEHLDETFLQRNFGENGGYLYEFKNNGSYEFEDLGTDPSAYLPLLNLETHQSSGNPQNFMNLVQVINRPPTTGFTDQQFIKALSGYLNPGLFLMHIAIEAALHEADGICGGVVGMNNFDLYQFQNQTLYQLIPWDKDLAFSDPNTDILFGITNGTHINLLAQRLAGIPEYRNIYFDDVARAMSVLGGAGGWADNELNRQYALIHDAALNDPNKQCESPDSSLIPCGAAEFEANASWLHSFLSMRYASVLSQLAAYGYLAPSTGPVISEGGVMVWGGMRALSPGAVAVISGSGFGQEATATALPLPRILGSTFAAVDGVRVPLCGVSPESAQILVPNDLAVGNASVVICNDGALTVPAIVPVRHATPAIAAVVHVDGTNVSAANPPKPAETLVIYAVGLGAPDANVPIDAPAPVDPLALTSAAPQVSIGNFPAAVAFSGLVPGCIGLYQVNALLPDDLPPNATALGFTLVQSGESTSWQFPPE
ncbi:MAG: CotH kinase family protein [Acidobacteriia bacterium]|nr:CotH kinase family protein [Terriglobia bacterium]